MVKIKTLHIVRHGKSSWEIPGITDIDRPLLEVGIRNTLYIGDRMSNQKTTVDYILSSPAARAIHTALILARKCNVPVTSVHFHDALYPGSLNGIREAINLVPESVNGLMIVGHNPVFTDLANYFVPGCIDDMPTSCIVSITFESDTWNLKQAKPQRWDIDYPKKS